MLPTMPHKDTHKSHTDTPPQGHPQIHTTYRDTVGRNRPHTTPTHTALHTNTDINTSHRYPTQQTHIVHTGTYHVATHFSQKDIPLTNTHRPMHRHPPPDHLPLPFANTPHHSSEDLLRYCFFFLSCGNHTWLYSGATPVPGGLPSRVWESEGGAEVEPGWRRAHYTPSQHRASPVSAGMPCQ